MICFHAALDGHNRLKLYWIDRIDSVCLQLDDLAFAAGKVYHKFEQQGDRFSNRILEKAIAGLVFESFQMLDMECALALIIVASDAAHCGIVVFRLMYCKLFFDVPFFLFYFSGC